MLKTVRALFLYCGCLALLPLGAPVGLAADTLPSATGPVLLTVAGQLERTNEGDLAVFDRAGLESLGVVELPTSTPWTDGVPVFEGVLLQAILDATGATGETIFATAANDYTVEIPLEDASTWDVLVAMKQDGRDLSLRDRGPLWIVYPRDQHAELQDDVHNGKWIWQLVRLEVR